MARTKGDQLDAYALRSEQVRQLVNKRVRIQPHQLIAVHISACIAKIKARGEYPNSIVIEGKVLVSSKPQGGNSHQRRKAERSRKRREREMQNGYDHSHSQ